MNEVYVSARGRHYIVVVNGETYDEFYCHQGLLLTHSQMVDVALGYEEALNNYVGCWP